MLYYNSLDTVKKEIYLPWLWDSRKS